MVIRIGMILMEPSIVVASMMAITGVSLLLVRSK